MSEEQLIRQLQMDSVVRMAMRHEKAFSFRVAHVPEEDACHVQAMARGRTPDGTPDEIFCEYSRIPHTVLRACRDPVEIVRLFVGAAKEAMALVMISIPEGFELVVQD